MTKKQKRIITIVLVGFLVAYFCYQVAYRYTIGQNGTMNVPGMPGTSIQAPPGSTVTNVTDNGTDVRAIFHVGPDPGPVFHLVNTTWTVYNSTSGSTATATFTIVTPDHIEFKDSHGELWRYIISVCNK